MFKFPVDLEEDENPLIELGNRNISYQLIVGNKRSLTPLIKQYLQVNGFDHLFERQNVFELLKSFPS